MEYIMLEVDFTGNDDAHVVGFIAREVESEKEWLKQIKSAIRQELKDNDGYINISNSDNCETPFDSLEEVLSTFSMKKITKEEFLVLSNLFGSYDNVVEYGHTDNFLDYAPPAVKEKVVVKHGEVIEQVKLYCKDETSDKVYNVTLEKIEHGYIVNYENGKRLDKEGNPAKLTEGTKTEYPMAYEYAKEIFDALVKSKNKYTTDPSGIVNNKSLKIK